MFFVFIVLYFSGVYDIMGKREKFMQLFWGRRREKGFYQVDEDFNSYIGNFELLKFVFLDVLLGTLFMMYRFLYNRFV